MNLHLILLATGCVLSTCMSLDCNWKTHYEYQGRCCDICPSGEYPIQHCSNNNISSVCKKCKEKSDHCFCNDDLCENVECSKCSPSLRCKQGEELRRTGLFKFMYVCGPCPNQTYNDQEDTVCKPILDCRRFGLPILFPGNRTHNARCGCEDRATAQLLNKTRNCSVIYYQTNNGMVVGLVITGLVCLAMLIHLCIQRTRDQKTKKKHTPTSSFPKLPLDECGYKLSKEEIGEVCP